MLQIPTEYELIIRPGSRWFNLNLRDVWRYRDLLFLLVHRDFAAKYKQTVLGPIWFVLQPLLMTAVFVVVFGSLAGIPTDGLPPTLFYLAGLLAWSYFAQTFQSTSGTLVANAGLFGKVYFPRLIVPLSAVMSNLIALALQLVTFLAFWVYFKFFTAWGSNIAITSAVVWFPLLLVQIAALGLGVGLWLSALTTKYRDFTHLSGFILQVWLYATPVIYGLSQVPERWRFVAVLNPMAVPVELIRYMFLGQGLVAPGYIAGSAGTTLLLLVSGLAVFARVEKTFVDTV
jgi:lipopolysaccharide transport system permease protein